MISIEIENLKCNGCKSTIMKQLYSIYNIGEVKVDFDNDTVSYTGLAAKELVVNQLEKLGYPEKGNNSFWNKTKSVVSCATGKINN